MTQSSSHSVFGSTEFPTDLANKESLNAFLGGGGGGEGCAAAGARGASEAGASAGAGADSANSQSLLQLCCSEFQVFAVGIRETGRISKQLLREQDREKDILNAALRVRRMEYERGWDKMKERDRVIAEKEDEDKVSKPGPRFYELSCEGQAFAIQIRTHSRDFNHRKRQEERAKDIEKEKWRVSEDERERGRESQRELKRQQQQDKDLEQARRDSLLLSSLVVGTAGGAAAGGGGSGEGGGGGGAGGGGCGGRGGGAGGGGGA